LSSFSSKKLDISIIHKKTNPVSQNWFLMQRFLIFQQTNKISLTTKVNHLVAYFIFSFSSFARDKSQTQQPEQTKLG
jgi:hypothetical protein